MQKYDMTVTSRQHSCPLSIHHALHPQNESYIRLVPKFRWTGNQKWEAWLHQTSEYSVLYT